MPAEKGMNDFFKENAKKIAAAHSAHREDETSFGNMDLPPGINGGIAHLVDCDIRFVKEGNNKGKPYFYAAGTVKSPVMHKGMKIEGLRTSIMENLFDTPTAQGRKTFEDHWAWMLNTLRTLGVTTEDTEADDVRDAIKQLKEDGPHFHFRTWVGKKTVAKKGADGKVRLFDEDENGNLTPSRNKAVYKSLEEAAQKNPYLGREPRVQHQWAGVCEYDEEESAAAEGSDETAEVNEPAADFDETDNAQLRKPGKGNGVATATRKPARKAAPPDEEPEETVAADDEVAGSDEPEDDLASLAKAADSKTKGPAKTNAENRLKELAAEAGIAKRKVEDADNWAQVAEMIEGAGADAEATGDEDSLAGEDGEEGESADDAGSGGAAEPAKDDVVFFRAKVKDAKGKTVVKVLECEVRTVDTDAKTATIRDLADTKNVFKEVAWDKLHASADEA